MAYLMLTSATVLHTKPSRNLVSIPVGTTLTLKVTFHNDVGKQFFVTDGQLDFRPGRCVVLAPPAATQYAVA